jgi:hypothetical protein
VSAYCLDYLRDSLRFKKPLIKHLSASDTSGARTQPYSIFSVLLFLGLFFSTRHEFLKNQEITYLEKANEPEIRVGLTILRNKDPSEFSVHATHSAVKKSALDIYKNHLHSPTIIDGWIPADAPMHFGNPSVIELESKYWENWEG